MSKKNKSKKRNMKKKSLNLIRSEKKIKKMTNKDIFKKNNKTNKKSITRKVYNTLKKEWEDIVVFVDKDEIENIPEVKDEKTLRRESRKGVKTDDDFDGGLLSISEEIKKKIKFVLKKVSSTEWSGFIVYKIIGESSDISKLEFRVEDFVLMSIDSSSYTEFDYNEEFASFLMDNEEYMNGEYFFGLIHSHHSMSTSMSHEDYHELQVNCDKYPQYLSIVVNNRFEITAKVAIAIKKQQVVLEKEVDSRFKFVKNLNDKLIIYNLEFVSSTDSEEEFAELLKKINKLKLEGSNRGFGSVYPTNYPGNVNYLNSYGSEISRQRVIGFNYNNELEKEFEKEETRAYYHDRIKDTMSKSKKKYNFNTNLFEDVIDDDYVAENEIKNIKEDIISYHLGLDTGNVNIDDNRNNYLFSLSGADPARLLIEENIFEEFFTLINE